MIPRSVCFPFVGDVVGGSHVSAAGLIRRLDRTRFKPLVLLQHGEGTMAGFFAAAGIPFEIAPPSVPLEHGSAVGPVAAIRLAAGALPLARFLRRRGIGIVHCNDGRTLATWALATRLARAKLLWHHRGAPDAAGLRLAAPLLADRVVAVSQFAAPKPGRYSAAPRARVIHSPFDTTTHYDREGARAALIELLPDAGERTSLIAFSGALIDRKRPLLFVDAIAEVCHQEPERDIRGVLFGAALDDMADRVRARAEALGIADRVHVLGHRTPGPLWLAACDLLMVPAIHEPYGRTLIEAMLVGTPVVATASGGNIEAIDHERTGMLVPPEDAEALAAACLALLARPRTAVALAAAARREARLRYGEAAHAAAIMTLYGEMIDGGRRRHRRTIARGLRQAPEHGPGS